MDIIAIAICATICGADSWVHMELFGKSKLEWFQSFLELPGGFPPMTPSARFLPAWTQRSSRVASCLDPSHRRTAAGEVVAIDGKTARRSHDRAGDKGAMHLVSAWVAQNTLTLGQVRTARSP